ncbi:MAG: hypothetical protein FWD58_00745 [Firmicutes bacterium]|nr:hypothetical protein [Bacillota bacterium]
MKKISLWLAAALSLALLATMAGCAEGCGETAAAEHTVTITSHAPASIVVTDADGAAIASGAKVKKDAVLTVTATPVEGHATEVKVNGVKQTLANGKVNVTVTADTAIEASAAAIEHTVAITGAEGVTVTVKRGETAVATGAKVPYGTTLDITVEYGKGYTPTLKINDAAVALSAGGKAQHVVKGDVAIEVAQELVFDAEETVRAGHTAFDGAYLWTGSFEGAAEGADIEPNLTVPYGFTGLEASGRFTRAFKAIQLSGTAGNMQLLAYDGDYQNTAGTKEAGIYWNLLGNWDALSDEGINASEAMEDLHEKGDYMGYWGPVAGSVYNEETSAKSGSFQFLAANPGTYLLTCDIVKLAEDGFSVLSSHTVLITAIEADAQAVVHAKAKVDTAAAKWTHTGSYTGAAEGADISGNLELYYDVTRSEAGDIQFLPLFKVDSVKGGDAAKTQLLCYDMDVDDESIYWDVLNNWAAAGEIGTAHGGEQPLNTALAAKTGYRGFWGNAVAGNTLYQFAEGTNQKHVTIKMPYEFEFVAETPGDYLVTVEFVTFAEGFEKIGSYSVLVKVKPALAAPAILPMTGGTLTPADNSFASAENPITPGMSPGGAAVAPLEVKGQTISVPSEKLPGAEDKEPGIEQGKTAQDNAPGIGQGSGVQDKAPGARSGPRIKSRPRLPLPKLPRG